MPTLIKNNFPLLILLGALLGPIKTLNAWNEDYRPENIPLQRTVCVRNVLALSQGGSASVRSTQPDIPCAPNESRHTLVIGSNPKGSLALVPEKNYAEFYPPWVVSWPAKEDLMDPRLWHFTCFSNTSYDVLGTTVKKQHFRGEITSPSSTQSCEAASVMARSVCEEKLGGDEILEECFGIMGLFKD